MSPPRYQQRSNDRGAVGDPVVQGGGIAGSEHEAQDGAVDESRGDEAEVPDDEEDEPRFHQHLSVAAGIQVA